MTRGPGRCGATRALAKLTSGTAREELRRRLPRALARDDLLMVHLIVAALAGTRDLEVHALLTERLAATPEGEYERRASYRAAARTQG